MDTNSHELICKDEVFAVVGRAQEVSREPGHGLHEQAYEITRVAEFGRRGIPWRQPPRHPIPCAGVRGGEHVPHLFTHDEVIVDTKVIEGISSHELGPVMDYPRITGLRVGLILNLKNAKLEWKRVVL